MRIFCSNNLINHIKLALRIIEIAYNKENFFLETSLEEKNMYKKIRMFAIKGLLSLVFVCLFVITASASDMRSEYVSRGEAARLFHEMLEDSLPTFSSEYSISYKDLSSESPYYQEIVDLVRADFMEGRSETRFEPDAAITRAEFASLITRYVGQDGCQETAFSDISGHRAEADIRSAWAAGCMTGYPDGTFRPDNPITWSDVDYAFAHIEGQLTTSNR